MYTYVYTSSLQTQSYIQSSQKPWGNPLSNHTMITYTTTKKVILNTSRHTLFLPNTLTLRLLILIPSRTHSQSQQTQKRILVQHSTRITLVTEDNLKSIQAESYSIHFDQSQTLSNLNIMNQNPFSSLNHFTFSLTFPLIICSFANPQHTNPKIRERQKFRVF